MTQRPICVAGCDATVAAFLGKRHAILDGFRLENQAMPTSANTVGAGILAALPTTCTGVSQNRKGMRIYVRSFAWPARERRFFGGRISLMPVSAIIVRQN